MCGVEKTDAHRRKNNRIVGGLPVDKVSIRIPFNPCAVLG